MQHVLVIGASGTQGRAQVGALLEAGYAVSALSRAASGLCFPAAVGKIQGDLLEPASVSAALAQVDTVFLNLPSASFNPPEEIVESCDNFIVAARQSGLQRVVFNASLYVDDQPTGHVAHDNRFEIIQSLLACDIAVTAVCPVIFMENLLQDWTLPQLLRQRRLSYPHADTLPVSWISLKDLARIMIRLAESASAIGRKLVVGGPEALRGRDTAVALGRAWAQDIQFESRSIGEFARAMAGLFAPGNTVTQQRIQRDLRSVYNWYNERRPSPFTVDMSDFLAEYPMTLTTIDDWARDNNPFPTDTAGVANA